MAYQESTTISRGPNAPPLKCYLHDSKNDGFVPHYEAHVNHNLRTFDRVEDQGDSSQSYHPNNNSKRSRLSGKGKLICCLALVVVIGICIAVATPFLIVASHHNITNNTTNIEQASPSLGDLRTRETGVMITAVTVTSHLTTTHFATKTVVSIVTQTAPIPTSIAQAASSFYDAVHSISASLHESAQSRLSEALTYQTPSATLTTSHDTTTNPVAITGTELPGTPAASKLSGWLGFCGVPGMFCERDVEVEQADEQGVSDK